MSLVITVREFSLLAFVNVPNPTYQGKANCVHNNEQKINCYA